LEIVKLGLTTPRTWKYKKFWSCTAWGGALNVTPNDHLGERKIFS
jgi:hypothetical protein